MDDRVRIGKRIAEIRKSKGLTQEDLSKITGIAPGNIGRIEKGKYSTGITLLSRIADPLGKKVDFVDK